MDLSSHGRKRRGQEDPDRKEREGESETSDNKKGKTDTMTPKTELDITKCEPQPFQFVPPILRHRSHSPFPPFPRPYDLSMQIQGIRRPDASTAASPSTTATSPEKKSKQGLSTPSDHIPFLVRKQDDMSSVAPSSLTQHVTAPRLFPPKTKQSFDTVTPSCQSSIQSSLQRPLPQRPNYPTHFHKGSLIQLASGQMKKVEELETEDFILSASSNQDVTLDHSTLVKIEKDVTLGCVDLTFKVGTENLQVTVSATEDHPFFVYGGTWSSISPTMSMARYSLSCSQLSLGDVCISLTSSRISVPPSDVQEGKAGGSALPVSTSQVIVIPSETSSAISSSFTSSVSSSESTTVTYSMSASAVSTSDISAPLNVASGRPEETDPSNTREGQKIDIDVKYTK